MLKKTITAKLYNIKNLSWNQELNLSDWEHAVGPHPYCDLVTQCLRWGRKGSVWRDKDDKKMGMMGVGI